MMLYGVRFLLNLFEMLIYRRFLEAYIGNRRTGLELSVLIMGICAGISSFVNSLGNPVCNLLNTVMILWLFSLQYRAAGRSRIFAVLIYVGINFVTEPIGYVLHMAVVGVWGRDEMVSYFLLAFILEMLRLEHQLSHVGKHSFDESVSFFPVAVRKKQFHIKSLVLLSGNQIGRVNPVSLIQCQQLICA